MEEHVNGIHIARVRFSLGPPDRKLQAKGSRLASLGDQIVWIFKLKTELTVCSGEKKIFNHMNRNVIIFIIILIILASAGYFYLTPKIYPTKQIFQQGTNKQLDESIFKNLETDVITVVFLDNTTGPQAKENFISHWLNDFGLCDSRVKNNNT